MNESEIGQEAEFNQAKFEMERLHELMLRIDRCNINLLVFDGEMHLYYYEIVFNDLCSVLALISAKLKKEEEKNIIRIKDLISDFLKVCSIWNFYLSDSMSGKTNHKKLNKENFDMTKELLFKFRLELEELMDIHRIGNPSKADPRRAIVNN